MRKYKYLLLSMLFFSSVVKTVAGNQEPRGFVNDFANVVSADYRTKIEALAREIKQKTGAELAVVTVRSLEGESIDTYTSALFQKWGIGQKSKDNGILVLLAVSDRKVRIEVGYDLEGAITDGTSGKILDTYGVPFFNKGDYGKGLFNTSLAIAGYVGREYGAIFTGRPERIPSGRNTGKRGSGLFSLIVIILLIILTRGRIIPWLFLGAMLGGGGGRSSSGGFGGFGGGFGGFGGGMSGGGGASRGF
ncbi:TPM domain-containing protein [bacterium]|nr:TPM domain-containing protein [bacterium]